MTESLLTLILLVNIFSAFTFLVARHIGGMRNRLLLYHYNFFTMSARRLGEFVFCRQKILKHMGGLGIFFSQMLRITNWKGFA